MKPLILEYIDKYLSPEEVVNSETEYSTTLNLTVWHETQMPAIRSLSLDTQTYTKVSMEGTDSDQGQQWSVSRLDTVTHTFVSQESSDSDKRSS